MSLAMFSFCLLFSPRDGDAHNRVGLLTSANTVETVPHRHAQGPVSWLITSYEFHNQYTLRVHLQGAEGLNRAQRYA